MVPPPQFRVLRCHCCRLFQTHQVGRASASPSSWFQDQTSCLQAGRHLVRFRGVPGAGTNDSDGAEDWFPLTSLLLNAALDLFLFLLGCCKIRRNER